MKLNELNIKQAREGIQRKEFSSFELVSACLEKIKKLNPTLNAFISVCEEEALKDARKTDKAMQNGNTSPLLGIPIALKDLFLTKGIRTTAGSKVLENYVPPFDATVV